ncbi:MAG TPA: DUF58 domain-containing protein [Myxococcota bacterium]|nr:DUF58 domain-containing protein [Myxococcota bacterium]
MAGDLGAAYVSVEHLARFEWRARGLSLLPRQRRGSVLAGQHGSRVRGRGLDFEEIRAYLPGDDVRNLDWRVTLRTGRPQVRAYSEERDRPVLVVVDQRMSMFFGTRRALKSVVAAEVAALVAWMAFRAGDRVGAVVFGDSDLVRISALRSRARVHQVLGAIAARNTALRADLAVTPGDGMLDRALESALHAATHDHLVCVVSDFAGAGERTLELLRALGAHNDVVGVLVFDPAARASGGRGELVASSGELQVELDLADRKLREPLESFFAGRLVRVAELLRRAAAPLFAISTDRDPVEEMSRLLGRGRRGPAHA